MFTAQPKKKIEKEVNLNDDVLLDNILQSVDQQSGSQAGSAPFVFKPKVVQKHKASSDSRSPLNPFAKRSEQRPNSRENLKPRIIEYGAADTQGFTGLRHRPIKEEEMIEQFDSEELMHDTVNIDEDSPMSPMQDPALRDQVLDEDLSCFANAENGDFDMEAEPDNGPIKTSGTNDSVKTFLSEPVGDE